MGAVLYADDDEDDDADFRFAVMVKETEIVAELAERIFGAWQSPGPVLICDRSRAPGPVLICDRSNRTYLFGN